MKKQEEGGFLVVAVACLLMSILSCRHAGLRSIYSFFQSFPSPIGILFCLL